MAVGARPNAAPQQEQQAPRERSPGAFCCLLEMTTKTPRTTAKKSTAAGEAAPAHAQSAYRPEFCQVAIETLSEGHSMAGLAGRLGVARATVFNWRDRHPEFNEACVIGIAGAVYWWEQRASELARTGKGNPAMVIFGLKNRAAEDWRDRQEVEHKGGVTLTVSDTDERL